MESILDSPIKYVINVLTAAPLMFVGYLLYVDDKR